MPVLRFFLLLYLIVYACFLGHASLAFGASRDPEMIPGKHAYPLVQYANRTKLSQVFTEIRKEGKVNQVLAAYNRRYQVPFRSLKEAEVYFRNRLLTKQAEVVSCEQVMHGRKFQTETYTKRGDHQGVWTRGCYPGEKILVDDGLPVQSLYCGNIIDPSKTIPRMIPRSHRTQKEPCFFAVAKRTLQL
ncbi:MAG TPA: hypothetical protein VFM02_00530 [Candidatus Paceibacterota bacterium]|nr:hypothetical protein [Candidatus Paceibacterota bacterium]